MRAAAVQINSNADRQRNLARAEALVRAAAADGATLVALPERFDLRGMPEDYERAAEPLETSAAARWARELARELRSSPRSRGRSTSGQRLAERASAECGAAKLAKLC